jgi:pimeloyl-ACP methyl ester carboxylesterase
MPRLTRCGPERPTVSLPVRHVRAPHAERIGGVGALSTGAAVVLIACSAIATEGAQTSKQQHLTPTLKSMDAVSSSQAKQMQQTPLYQRYTAIAPHPERFPQLLDRMGELMKKDYDWRPELAKLRVPTLLLFADHDAVSMRHIAEFFALFDGGVRDAGWEGKPRYARARLAIVPGYTHYNFSQGPDIARVIEAYLEKPTSSATQFTP